jgi:hypothetical protein
MAILLVAILVGVAFFVGQVPPTPEVATVVETPVADTPAAPVADVLVSCEPRGRPRWRDLGTSRPAPATGDPAASESTR